MVTKQYAVLLSSYGKEFKYLITYSRLYTYQKNNKHCSVFNCGCAECKGGIQGFHWIEL